MLLWEHECLHPVSGTEKDVLSAMSSAQTLQDDASDNSVNILLLGETGVGKSAFMNALCNYLTYPTLDDALDGKFHSPKYCDEGLSNKDEGTSPCTLKCKAYTFPIGKKKLVRFVDIPRIGDTRNFDQDIKNIEEILSFMSAYKVLNAICILLKPNDMKPSAISLKYWFVELLTHLHKDASCNIIFCYTNSRSNLFPVLGVTKSLLKRMLSWNASPTPAIKLDAKTIYEFDSEGFRFLESARNGSIIPDCETDAFRSSWRRSVDEASRLIQHISSLDPLSTPSMLSLIRVRDMLAILEIPLAEILAVLEEKLEEIINITKEVNRSLANSPDKGKSLIIRENILQHMRTICTQPSCKDVICHDNCSRHERGVRGLLIGGMLRSEQNLFCTRLSLRTGKCKTCNCPNDSHISVSHESRTVVREREDRNIQRALHDETGGEVQMNLNDISRRAQGAGRVYQGRNEGCRECCCTLC